MKNHEFSSNKIIFRILDLSQGIVRLWIRGVRDILSDKKEYWYFTVSYTPSWSDDEETAYKGILK